MKTRLPSLIWLQKKWLHYSHIFEGKPTEKSTQESAVRNNKIVAHGIYNTAFAFLVAISLNQTETITPTLSPIHSGEIAENDVVVPFNFEYTPNEDLNIQKEVIEKNTPPVFDYDDLAMDAWARRWEVAFQTVRTEFYTSSLYSKHTVPEGLNRRLIALTDQLLTPSQILFLHQHKFSESIEQIFMEVSRSLAGKMIASNSLLPFYYNTGIFVRLTQQSNREVLIQDVSRISNFEQVRDYLFQKAHTKGKSASYEQALDLISLLLVPNLKFNDQLTNQRIEQAYLNSRISSIYLRRGQLIVQKGERISYEQAEVVKTILDYSAPSQRLKRFLLSFGAILFLFSVLFRLNLTGRQFWFLSLKDALLFQLITVSVFIIFRFLTPQIQEALNHFGIFGGAEYCFPVASVGIILCLLMGKETAFTFAMISSIILGYLWDKSFNLAVYSFLVTASAILSLRNCKQRSDVYVSGFWSGLVGVLLLVCFSITDFVSFKRLEWNSMLIITGLSFASGLISSILASTLIPLFEWIFRYTSNLKLLELSNFNHPLLHNLMLKAPGTYHHSVIVGSLAELAADRIKANSLLVRVAAYYHDIGKMTKPMYFIENQTPNNNPHDQLQPSMSAKILFSHVKEGVRLGKEHNLGKRIVDVIEQHHGTTLVAYFLSKAKQTEGDSVLETIENEFRYPGPKPQSKEAAIVMLADACEASTRSIHEPTASKIQAMVHHVINKRFLEEQFSDCDLTLRDLKTIEDCFCKTLISLYHHRIEYPHQKQATPRSLKPDHPVKKEAS